MAHSGKFQIAAIQWGYRPINQFETFARHVRDLLDQAADSQIVTFSELFTLNLLTSEPKWREFKKADFGRVTKFTAEYQALFSEEAQKRQQVILAGTHLVGETSRNLNTAHLFLPDGTFETHSKTHIFPSESENGTIEGESLKVIDLGFVTLGLMICYEAEVPEIATILARRGAELVLCPSLTTTPAGFWRVRYCVQARCIENQVYCVHCSTVGKLDAPFSEGFGKSAILSPCDTAFPVNGVLAEAQENQTDVITACLDLDLLHENRLNGAAPTYQDRLRRMHFYHAHQDELLPGFPT